MALFARVETKVDPVFASSRCRVAGNRRVSVDSLPGWAMGHPVHDTSYVAGCVPLGAPERRSKTFVGIAGVRGRVGPSEDLTASERLAIVRLEIDRHEGRQHGTQNGSRQ